jgi:hypothetical protein
MAILYFYPPILKHIVWNKQIQISRILKVLIFRILPYIYKIDNFEFVYLGTTWTQELVWMILNKCDPIGSKAPFHGVYDVVHNTLEWDRSVC